MIKRLFPALIFSVAACSNGVNAPSLMPRAIEKAGSATPPAAAPVNSAPIDPALQRQIDALMSKVTSGDTEFSKVDASSGRALTAGRRAAEGSEAWVNAQQAQSALEAAGQDSAAALGEIETLLLAQTQDAASNPALGGIAELTAAEGEAAAIVARQTARLQELMR